VELLLKTALPGGKWRKTGEIISKQIRFVARKSQLGAAATQAVLSVTPQYSVFKHSRGWLCTISVDP
jgi:hypothetical protein